MRKMLARVTRLSNSIAITTHASPKAQDEPPHSLRLHSSQFENGETSDKKARKEKKKQRRLDHERAQKDSGSTPVADVNAYNGSSGVCKDLSQIKCFNCNKKGHYSRNCPEPRKDAPEN